MMIGNHHRVVNSTETPCSTSPSTPNDDFRVGQLVTGSISFDVCNQPFHDLDAITVAVEMLEYSVPIPTPPAPPSKKYPTIFSPHPPIPIVSKNLSTDGRFKKGATLSVGHYVHPFELCLPPLILPTGSKAPNQGDDAVNLVLYRIHVNVNSNSKDIAAETAYKIIHVLP
ncbi:hypothetical protein BC829DRAFT_386431 [Chytridium lagenaria]|nr:hypothetical protein BC829DRAFT_386431 [Chytridium lagenaria]